MEVQKKFMNIIFMIIYSSGEMIKTDKYKEKDEENLITVFKKKDATIKASRWGFLFTLVFLIFFYYI